MFSLFRAAWVALAVSWHKLAGSACLRLGRIRMARHHFETVLELKGDDFRAYVGLGRAAYALGDYAGWRREYEHAKRLRPDRFAQLKNPFDMFAPRAAGAIREEMGERATWRTVRIPHRGQAGPQGLSDGPLHGFQYPGDPFAGFAGPAETGIECPGGPRRRFGDDFRDEGERETFRSRAPIAAGEISAVDLEKLARDLTA